MDIQKSVARETLAPTVTRSWLDNEQIAVFHFTDTNRATIEALSAAVAEVIQAWPRHKPYLVLYDPLAWNPGVVSPVMRVNMLRLYNMAVQRNLQGRIAINLHRKLLSKIFQLFIQINQPHTLPTRLFYDETLALAWLRELQLPQHDHSESASHH